MANQTDVHVEPLLLESGSFIQNITLRLNGLERSMIVYTTKDPGEAARLSAELQGVLRRLVAAAAAARPPR